MNLVYLLMLPLFAPQLAKKPLTAMEFIGPLAKIDPIYKEEEEAFKVLAEKYLWPWQESF